MLIVGEVLIQEDDSRYRVLVSFEGVLLRIVPLRATAEDGNLRFVGNDSKELLSSSTTIIKET